MRPLLMLGHEQAITITRNEILTGLKKPDDFILALVEVVEK